MYLRPVTRWEPTRVRWVTDTLESSTGATRVETDAGPAYMKLMGNPEGPQALFCEYLGTRAAAWLGLPTFTTAIVNVTEPALVTYKDGSSSSAGPAFVARFEPGFTWDGSADVLDSLDNPDDVSGLVVLDTWLLNCDRYRPEAGSVRCNTRNVFLSSVDATKGNVRLVAMDHTHILTCGAPLSKRLGHIDRVRDTRLYGHFPGFRRFLTHRAVRRFFTRLGQFTRQDAEHALEGVPAAWSPDAEVREAGRRLHARSGGLRRAEHSWHPCRSGPAGRRT
jgi:hypothetical protein